VREFEERALGTTFGPKREKLIVDWRKLHSEVLQSLKASPNITRVIRQRAMRWVDIWHE
jgi:hypothetical protein